LRHADAKSKGAQNRATLQESAFDRMLEAMKRVLARVRLFAVALALAGCLAAAPAQAADARLDRLFERLIATQDQADAKAIERSIWQIWLDPKDSSTQSLLDLALVAEQRGDQLGAFALFDAIVVLKPDYAEGWNRRATILFQLGRLDESKADAEKVVALEPRHFGALSGLGLIAQARNDDTAALEAFERALAVNPHMPQIRTAVDDLRRKRRNGAI
jgi:tetratricopeptide (TPR) repeat protein